MRHHLLARPPLPLAPGVGVTALAAILVAFASSALGASSGLARTIGAAIALSPVAVAADAYSAAAAGAQKKPGRRLGSWHGRSCPCAKPTSGQIRPLREILCAQRCSPVGPRGATVCLPASYWHCRACFLHRQAICNAKDQRGDMPLHRLTPANPIQRRLAQDKSMPNAAGTPIRFKGSKKKPVDSAGELG